MKVDDARAESRAEPEPVPGVSPDDPLESGVEATMRLIADPDLDGVTGKYLGRLRESRAHPQAYDADARRRLRELSAGPEAPGAHRELTPAVLALAL